jgi:hypothetical protein
MFRAEAAVGARNSKQPGNKIAIAVKATEPIEYLDVETTGSSKPVTVRGNEIE